MQVARQRGKRRVVGKPLKKFRDVGDPERPLKARFYLVQTLGKRQSFLLRHSVLAARCCRTASALIPLIRTTFRRFVSPLAMVTEERGISKKLAKNSITAWLALPSTGGAVSASFTASPTVPVMAFLRARGWTFTANVAPLAPS